MSNNIATSSSPEPTHQTAEARFAARDRALPGWAIDLIRDGVPASDLKDSGEKAVWWALRRTALSAQVRGQDETEWLVEVMDLHHNLARQFALRHGRTKRSNPAIRKALGDIWDKAWEYRTTLDQTLSREQVVVEANLRADAITALVADPEVVLTESERAVLAYAAEQARARGMLRVVMPRRAVMERASVGERAARTALSRLCEKGLLTLVAAGRGAQDEKRRKANLYAIPKVETLTAYARGEVLGTRPVRLGRHRPYCPSVPAAVPVADGEPRQWYDLPEHPEVTVAQRDGRLVVELPVVPHAEALRLLREAWTLPVETPSGCTQETDQS